MITSTMFTDNTKEKLAAAMGDSFAHEDAPVPHDGGLSAIPAPSASGHHMTEAGWCCPPPELPAGPVEDNDMSLMEETTQGGQVQVEMHADAAAASNYGPDHHPILRQEQHAGDNADAEDDEAEMVELSRDIFSPVSDVWSEDSFPRSSSAASTAGMSNNNMLGASVNYTVDATPGPVPALQQQQGAEVPPAPPSPPPPLAFGRRDGAAPATAGRLPQPAARMLAANTPMQEAIEAGDGDVTGGSHRRSSLDMALHDTDSCSSWMDDNDGIQQGAVEGEDSPHFAAQVLGTPMAFSLATKFSPSRLH